MYYQGYLICHGHVNYHQMEEILTRFKDVMARQYYLCAISSEGVVTSNGMEPPREIEFYLIELFPKIANLKLLSQQLHDVDHRLSAQL